jgi:hypothetical protein
MFEFWATGCQRLASLELPNRRIELLAAIPVFFDQLLSLRDADTVLPGKVIDLVLFSAGDPAPIGTSAIGFVIRHSVTPYTTSTVPECATRESGFTGR